MEKSNLNEPTEVNLTGCTSPGEIAQRERWGNNEWAVAMADRIRDISRPLDAQRERLAALVVTGARADQASAEVLGQHFVMLEALFQRFTSEAVRAGEGGGARSVERVDVFMRGALKAQRAAVSCLSALKSLRDSPTPTRSQKVAATLTTAAPAASSADPRLGTLLGEASDTGSGIVENR